ATPIRPRSVHPHARGDNKVAAARWGHPFGSPPRAWGQRRYPGRKRGRQRFTPTRVGTTQPDTGVTAFDRGSPPRAWGQLAVVLRVAQVGRFTPTRVGTTLMSALPRSVKTVHPHA